MELINNLNIKKEGLFNQKSNYMNINDNEEKNKRNDLRKNETIPIKFRESYLNIENKLNNYIIDLKKYFYREIFDKLFLNLKDLYALRFKKYIEIKNEYHSSIAENEFLIECEENLNDTNKREISQIIQTLTFY